MKLTVVLDIEVDRSPLSDLIKVLTLKTECGDAESIIVDDIEYETYAEFIDEFLASSVLTDGIRDVLEKQLVDDEHSEVGDE